MFYKYINVKVVSDDRELFNLEDKCNYKMKQFKH